MVSKFENVNLGPAHKKYKAFVIQNKKKSLIKR